MSEHGYLLRMQNAENTPQTSRSQKVSIMTDLDRLTIAARAVLATDFAQGKARLCDETDRAAQELLRSALEPDLLEVFMVESVEDADGALCLECGWQTDEQATGWWPVDQVTHEHETGHATQLFTYTPPGPSS